MDLFDGLSKYMILCAYAIGRTMTGFSRFDVNNLSSAPIPLPGFLFELNSFDRFFHENIYL